MEIVIFETLIQMKLEKEHVELPIREYEKVFLLKITDDMESFLSKKKIESGREKSTDRARAADPREYQGLNPRMRKIIRKKEQRQLQKQNSLRLLIKKKLEEKEQKKKENPTVKQMLESKYSIGGDKVQRANELQNLKLVSEKKRLFMRKQDPNSQHQSNTLGVDNFLQLSLKPASSAGSAHEDVRLKVFGTIQEKLENGIADVEDERRKVQSLKELQNQGINLERLCNKNFMESEFTQFYRDHFGLTWNTFLEDVLAKVKSFQVNSNGNFVKIEEFTRNLRKYFTKMNPVSNILTQSKNHLWKGLVLGLLGHDAPAKGSLKARRGLVNENFLFNGAKWSRQLSQRLELGDTPIWKSDAVVDLAVTFYLFLNLLYAEIDYKDFFVKTEHNEIFNLMELIDKPVEDKDEDATVPEKPQTRKKRPSQSQEERKTTTKRFRDEIKPNKEELIKTKMKNIEGFYKNLEMMEDESKKLIEEIKATCSERIFDLQELLSIKRTIWRLMETIELESFTHVDFRDLIERQKELERTRIRSMEKLMCEYLDFKRDVREEEISVYDMTNYLHEYLDNDQPRQDFIQIIKIFQDFMRRKELELHLVRVNQDKLLRSRHITLQTLMHSIKEPERGSFVIKPDEVFDIKELETAFYNFKVESRQQREILEGFCARAFGFVENLFPLIGTKIKKKKNRCMSRSMKSSLTLYFCFQSMLKLEEALEEQAEFFQTLIGLFEEWSVGQTGCSLRVLNFLYNHFGEMTFKRMKKLSMRVFLLGKSGFEDMSQVYKALVDGLSRTQSKAGSKGNNHLGEESWERVKLIDPKMKSEGWWTQFDMLFPVNFYEDKINQQIIGKKLQDWYLRPHHIETVTEHPKSVKDNVLNPKYYSQLNYDEQGDQEENFEQWKKRKGCKFKMSEEEDGIRRNIYETDKLIRQIQNARNVLDNRQRHLEYEPESTGRGFGFDCQRNSICTLNNKSTRRCMAESRRSKWRTSRRGRGAARRTFRSSK